MWVCFVSPHESLNHWEFSFPCCRSKDGFMVHWWLLISMQVGHVSRRRGAGQIQLLHVPSLGTLGVSWAPAVPVAWKPWGNKISRMIFSTRQFTCRNIIYQVPLTASGIRNGEWEKVGCSGVFSKLRGFRGFSSWWPPIQWAVGLKATHPALKTSSEEPEMKTNPNKAN